MTLKIREATGEDAAWFVEHLRALVVEPDVAVPLRLEEYVTTPEQQAEVMRGAAERGDVFFLAEADGVRVGELNLRRGTRIAFKHSTVLGLSIAKAWRGQGVGSALMQHALEWARAQGNLRRVELWVYASNTTAIRLYERHGFVVEGRRRGSVRVGDGYVDDLLMTCHLA